MFIVSGEKLEEKRAHHFSHRRLQHLASAFDNNYWFYPSF